ncbi:putative ribonuclease H-like domain-containing protein [Tanacetum coccineum]
MVNTCPSKFYTNPTSPSTQTVTGRKLQALIMQGVDAALVEEEAEAVLGMAYVMKWVEKYVGGLPETIHDSVMVSKQKAMQEAIKFATELMDKKIRDVVENKRNERKEYAGTLSLCNKCKLHHNGPCTVKCGNCKKVGHMTRDCRNPTAARNQGTFTCYEYRNQGHYRSDCPELKNQNHGNQTGGAGERGMMLALGGGETEA